MMLLASNAHEIMMYAIEHLKKEFIGKDVILTCGQFEGRWGNIVDVLYDTSYGMVYCVMVYKVIGGRVSGEFLNSTHESRKYRPAEQFEVIEGVLSFEKY